MMRTSQFVSWPSITITAVLLFVCSAHSAGRNPTNSTPESQGRFDYQLGEKFTPYRIPAKHLDPEYRRLILQKLRYQAQPSSLFFSRDFTRWRSENLYDRTLDWDWSDPRGFGRFNRISMQSGNILAIANQGGLLFGRLFTGTDSTHTGCLSNVDCYVWEEIGTRLKSPSFIADAAFKRDELKNQEIVVIIPSDEDPDLMEMYETKDLGQTWKEVKIEKGRGAYFALRNQGKYSGGNNVTELHQFPVKERKGRAFRMFLYNYNDIDQQYGYYFDGIKWRPSLFDQVFPANNGNQIPEYAQQTYFTSAGVGLLTPHKTRLYLTKDFGATWKHLDYSDSVPFNKTVKSMAFGVTEDGSRIYLALNIDSEDVYFAKGVQGSDGEYSWKNPRKINESNYQVQFMTIKAHSKDDLTLWYYIDGPLQTLNADEESITFTPLFPYYQYSKPAAQDPEFFINGSPEYLSMRYSDTEGTEKHSGGIFTYLPVDLREVFQHPSHPNETLIASDHGLYVVGNKVSKANQSYAVYLKNLAESRDHSEVYSVAVDACGCIYSGQWHGSASFTCKGSWIYPWIYRGGEARGLFVGENRFNCNPGNEWIGNWGELKKKATFTSFAKRCDDNSDLFCKQKLISNAKQKQIPDSSRYAKPKIPPLSVNLSTNPLPNAWPTFAPGTHFIYVALDNKLYVLSQNEVVEPSQVEPAAQLLDDKLLKSNTERNFVFDDSENVLYALRKDQNGNIGLYANDLEGGGWQAILQEDDLPDGYIFEQSSRFDVRGDMLAVSLKKTTDNTRELCVFNDLMQEALMTPCYSLLSKSDCSSTSSCSASEFQNPWYGLAGQNDADYQRVVIDPICPTRIYALLRNTKSTKHCTQKMLVSDSSFLSEGNGDTVGKRSWKLFGQKPQCGIIHELDFDVDRKLMFLATQGRGTMVGSLSGLSCPK